MTRRHIGTVITLALSLGIPTSLQGQRGLAGEPVGAEDRWANLTLRNHHADMTALIDSRNAQRLKLAWAVKTQDHVSHTPLVDGNRVFFADWGGHVYAVDKSTGKVLWKKKVQETVKKEWPWHGIAGTGAMSDDLLFEASVEGMAWALDKETGRVVWERDIAEDEHAGSLAKMLHYDGLVYIGLQSVEEPMTRVKKNFDVNFRGKVMALNARTGELVWETWLVTPPHTGVPVWSSFALDPEMNTLYFTTGNNYTGVATDLSDALVAVDAKTGKIKWHRQVYMHDVWTAADPKGPDYDFGAGPQLFEAGGRKLVGAGNKSGVFFVWDRVTGEPVWTHTVGYGEVGGGIHGEASIGHGRVYIWGNNSFKYGSPPEKHPIDITSVDAATGTAYWTKPKVQPAVEISAGFLANDVWFVGSLDGKVRAYSAVTGEHLWTSQQHGAVGSSLWVDGGLLMWGAGVPKKFSGVQGQPNGLFAYTANP